MGHGSCAFSHELALQKAQRLMDSQNYPAVLILEDDPAFSDRLESVDGVSLANEAIRAMMTRAPSNCMFLQLGAMIAGPCQSKWRNLCNSSDGFRLCIAERCYQTHCYIVSQRAIPLLLQYLADGAKASAALCFLQ